MGGETTKVDPQPKLKGGRRTENEEQVIRIGPRNFHAPQRGGIATRTRNKQHGGGRKGGTSAHGTFEKRRGKTGKLKKRTATKKRRSLLGRLAEHAVSKDLEKGRRKEGDSQIKDKSTQDPIRGGRWGSTSFLKDKHGKSKEKKKNRGAPEKNIDSGKGNADNGPGE